MPEPSLGRMSRTVLDTLVTRFRARVRRDGSCPSSGIGRAGFLSSWGAWSGLDGPMPRTIALVVRGRCRPSPDRVAQGASSDRHSCRVVARGLAVLAGERLLPVLGAPGRGVGRVHHDDGQTELCGHSDEPGPQPGHRHAGDQPAETLAAPMLLSGLVRLEIQVLDTDGRSVPLRPVQQSACRWPLPRLPIGLQKPPLRRPTPPPLGHGERRLIQIVTGVEQAFPAARHPDTTSRKVGTYTGQPVLEHVQTPRLGKPFPLGAVAPRHALRALRTHRESRATGPEVRSRQRTQMVTDQPQYSVILGWQALETSTDRHATRPDGHERRIEPSQVTHVPEPPTTWRP